MDLVVLLRQAAVHEGSFYPYFPSREAFGAAMLRRYFVRYLRCLHDFFNDRPWSYRQGVLDYYDHLLLSCKVSSFAGCLYVKLSAKVCEFSEAMRGALEAGALTMIGSLAATLNKAQQQGTLSGQLNCPSCARTIYIFWLVASPQSKICREKAPLLNARQVMEHTLRSAQNILTSLPVFQE
ncbi:TetR/AcrR family transcriptional regulator [Erwinia amylovora]|uniref:TetR/AcrR family transcriptional regulator n=2 Tax=Erwinia amylovora TaxID=552 RepID=UPI0002CBED27|nr:TetR/AcrR family transcriptional regulator [Erwinia amylovora]CCP07143.1 transcriptional regulator [Erwinia amylovora MR1]